MRSREEGRRTHGRDDTEDGKVQRLAQRRLLIDADNDPLVH